eukprot:5610674-Pyramimonas_sp.AAC.1
MRTAPARFLTSRRSRSSRHSQGTAPVSVLIWKRLLKEMGLAKLLPTAPAPNWAAMTTHLFSPTGHLERS